MARPADTYFAAYFNKKGELIGVDAPGGQVAKKHDLNSGPISFQDVDDVINMTIISKKGHSPCCIQIGRIIYCWC